MGSYSRAWLVTGALVVLFALGCGSNSANGNAPAESPTASDQPAALMTSCNTEADCAPATCCHATSCVLIDQAPKECGEMMCSAECAEGSMDCGKGSCVCLEGQCQVERGE